MKYVVDTHVYLEAVRSEETRAQFRKTVYPLLPATYLSAVVAYQLAVASPPRKTDKIETR